MSQTERVKIEEIVRDMTRQGVVKPSKSPWAASVVLVKKKDGSTRFCVDYRKLNSITKRDTYPLPRVDDTLDRLGGSKFFTALDLTAGYWQVEMEAGSGEKTAFSTPGGLFEFTVMPFGLTNAPATFQRLMDQVLSELGFEYVLVYLDDVLIHSKSFEEHMLHTEAVLACIRDANLSVKLKKCKFAQLRTLYLGHIISEAGVEPDPEKLKAVSELLPPSCVKELRMFLGFVGYYRRFIENFSRVAKPLTDLTKKGVMWAWSSECQVAFESLRVKLTTAPIMAAC
jgi:hypothetical protein